MLSWRDCSVFLECIPVSLTLANLAKWKLVREPPTVRLEQIVIWLVSWYRIWMHPRCFRVDTNMPAFCAFLCTSRKWRPRIIPEIHKTLVTFQYTAWSRAKLMMAYFIALRIIGPSDRKVWLCISQGSFGSPVPTSDLRSRLILRVGDISPPGFL